MMNQNLQLPLDFTQKEKVSAHSVTSLFFNVLVPHMVSGRSSRLYTANSAPNLVSD